MRPYAAISPCDFTLATPARSTSACPKSLACDLVTLRCVLNGHLEVPHLADAEEDQNSALFKDHIEQAYHPDPFWNSRFLSYVQGYYQECSTILNFVPERERKQGDKVFWLVARFDAWWYHLPRIWATHGARTVHTFVAKPNQCQRG